MRELAEAMSPKVTAQAISKYEAGKMLPSSAVLVGLGKALDVSLGFLMSAQIEALDAVEFRKHSGASARDRARVEVAVMDRLERYLAIEHRHRGQRRLGEGASLRRRRERNPDRRASR